MAHFAHKIDPKNYLLKLTGTQKIRFFFTDEIFLGGPENSFHGSWPTWANSWLHPLLPTQLMDQLRRFKKKTIYPEKEKQSKILPVHNN